MHGFYAEAEPEFHRTLSTLLRHPMDSDHNRWAIGLLSFARETSGLGAGAGVAGRGLQSCSPFSALNLSCVLPPETSATRHTHLSRVSLDTSHETSHETTTTTTQRYAQDLKLS